MPNVARPSQDISRGSWVTGTNGTTNLWSHIDETTPSDGDFVQSALADNTAYEVRLNSVPPAVIPYAHNIQLRGLKNASGGNQKGVDVSLVQGTTVIGTQSFPNLPAIATNEVIDVPRSMASQITDYADLRIRFMPTGSTSGGSSRRRVVIPYVALNVPAAADLVDDLLTRWGITVDQQNGTWQVSKSGFVGVGETLARSVFDLYERMRDADFADAERERRYTIAVGLWKVISYEQLRDEFVAGTRLPPSHQTQQEAISICDEKIARFIASSRAADAEDGA